MKLVFDDQAIADLEDIYYWIAEDSPAAAKSVTERLFGSIELLISFPFMGHAGLDPETLNGSCRDCHMSWCTRLTGQPSASS